MEGIGLTEIISALIGAFVGAFGTILTFKTSCRQIFADNVSKSRMDWINKFRDEVATIVKALRILPEYLKLINENKQLKSTKKEKQSETTIEEKYLELLSKAEENRSRLLTRLNCDGYSNNDGNMQLSLLLESIDFKNLNNKEYIIEQIQHYTKIILEPEWRKVKQEARGKYKNEHK